MFEKLSRHSFSMNKFIFSLIIILSTSNSFGQEKVELFNYRYITNVNGTLGRYTSVLQITLFSDSTFQMSWNSGTPFAIIRLYRNMKKFEPDSDAEFEYGNWSVKSKKITLKTKHWILDGNFKKRKLVLYYKYEPDFVEKVVYKKYIKKN